VEHRPTLGTVCLGGREVKEEWRLYQPRKKAISLDRTRTQRKSSRSRVNIITRLSQATIISQDKEAVFQFPLIHVSIARRQVITRKSALNSYSIY
jgi:hypothetical protein